MPQINGGRLLADLRRLAEFGAYKSGVHRPTFSPQDIEARHWLAGRFTEAGLDASIDGIGNVFGRSRATGPRLLIGSHTESQNHAGWLDGALGVIYGLEVARAFSEDPRTAGFPIDVASWADEEGHFGSFLGSRSFIGDVTDEEIDKARDHNDGTPLREALANAGLAERKRETIMASDYIGYLEAHIEQGDTLDEAGLRLGVVTGIVGIRQYRIVFVGEANHAGTTRMVQRKDAGVALVKLAAAIAERFPQITGPRSVWTTGAIRLEPGQPSIVPGRAEMMFQVRDIEAAQLQRFEDSLLALVAEANAAGPCAVTMETVWTVSPVLDVAGVSRRVEPRGRKACAGRLHFDAERRRARCADPGAKASCGDAVRAQHQRREPPLDRGYERGRHRSRLPGSRRCGGGDRAQA